MNFPFPSKKWEKNEWAQIKNITKQKIIELLKKDPRWEFRRADGGRYIFHNPKLPPPYENIAIHYHPHEGYRNASLLKNILDHWCCSRDDLRKWKVVR